MTKKIFTCGFPEIDFPETTNIFFFKKPNILFFFQIFYNIDKRRQNNCADTTCRVSNANMKSRKINVTRVTRNSNQRTNFYAAFALCASA